MTLNIFQFLDKSPSAFHAAANACQMLQDAGYEQLDETSHWQLKPGKGYFVTRNQSSVVAFQYHGKTTGGFRLVTGHTDSPAPKLKLAGASVSNGSVRVPIQIYGGDIHTSWQDRPLGVAGRIAFLDAKKQAKTALVNINRPVAVIPNYYIGDDMKLKQVLINILSNAIKFTEKGGNIVMEVERKATYGDQSTIKFVIKDTGIGMEKSFIPKIFDSFTQEDSSRNNKYGSTGLGMAITKNIVELMNGTISVESEKGVGTEFTVVVTLKNCEHQGPATSYIKPKDMRVLIVDDEEIAAEHARMVLDEVGISADCASSGAEALKMLELQHTKHEPYNLVLLDWKMPEMDGLEVSKEIRKRYSKETTIIILTSFNWDEIMDEALHIGVDSFLAKPLFASNVIDEFERIARKNNMSLFRERRRADLNGKKILLAEDIQINAEIMKQILKIKGAEIDHAENGRIVLEMFANSAPKHYDAILMDVRMPEMDGLEATAKIRALDRKDAKTIPIIAMTANAFDEDVQRSLQVGMNAHLSKPVEPEHLYSTLEELIWESEQTD